MKKMMYVCNRCGEPITGKLVKIVPYYCSPDNEEYGDPVDKEAPERHYCEECTSAIFLELTAYTEFVTKKKDKKPTAATKKGKPKTSPETEQRKKKLDIGKVMALYNGQWSIEDIASEMHEDKERIYKAIYYQTHKFKKEDAGNGKDA